MPRGSAQQMPLLNNTKHDKEGDMVIWVKTTIDIASGLLMEAKERARRDQTTLRELVERGLGMVLSEPEVLHPSGLQTGNRPAGAPARRRSLSRLGRHPRLDLRHDRQSLIAVDTNILVYAYDESAPMHERALAAMDRLVSEPSWGLPWIVAGEFYGGLTGWSPLAGAAGRSGTGGARRMDRHARSVDCSARCPVIGSNCGSLIAAARPQGRPLFRRRSDRGGLPCGWRVPSCGAADGDFSWYPQLRVRNPLVEPPG